MRYKVIDKVSDEVLEEIEESKAFFQVRTSDLATAYLVYDNHESFSSKNIE